MEQMKDLFTREDEAGIVNIDAICFVIKAPDARFTPTQKYIFESIMSLFGRDIETNFFILITFADGKEPPVLSALENAKLPHSEYFTFNNSGLFADNSCENKSVLSYKFWNMSCRSFEKFFERLNKTETKSLKQTRDVLLEREKLENTIVNLLRALDAGLNKVEELRIEIAILEQHKTEIDANKNFKYTVTETHQKQTPLPKGVHVTNCLHCNFTCHENCNVDDQSKYRCSAMKNGKCTQCPDRCTWDIHKSSPYKLEYSCVEVEKTYAEKLEKYRQATNEYKTTEKAVDRMNEDVKKLESSVDDMMAQINECNTKLKEIALRPEHLSLLEHIDSLIKSEQHEKCPGFIERINALKTFRKRSTVIDDINRFRQVYKTLKSKIEQTKQLTN